MNTLLTVRESAKCIGVNRSTLARAITQGHIKAHPIEGSPRGPHPTRLVCLEDVRAWHAKHQDVRAYFAARMREHDAQVVEIDRGRMESGLTVAEAAFRIGVTENAVRDAIKGKRLAAAWVMGHYGKPVWLVDEVAAERWRNDREGASRREAAEMGYTMTVDEAAARFDVKASRISDLICRYKVLHSRKFVVPTASGMMLAKHLLRPEDVQAALNRPRRTVKPRPAKAEAYTPIKRKNPSAFGNAKWKALSDEPRPVPAWREERV